MPIYSYHCNKCKSKFDLLVGVTSDETELKCSKCGSKDIEKQMSTFSCRKGLSTTPSSSGSACSTGGCCPTC